MKNETYLETLGVGSPETIQKCLAAMEKYGDNKWWEPDIELRTYAYYQMNEDLLLRASISDLKQGLSDLVGRPVYTHELIDPEFKQEVECAYRYGVGCTSNVERLERFEAGLDRFRERFPGKVIEVNLPAE